MYAKNRMITDLITIFPDASISLAFQTMKERNISQLPVVKDGKLIGLITEETLKDFSPSKATTLSVYELNYVLNKTKIHEVMQKEVITAEPEDLIETVAAKMLEQDSNIVPIIEKDHKLVGVICRADIINSFLEMLGTKDSGTRISILAKDEVGSLATVVDKIKAYNLNITHISVFDKPEQTESEVIVRIGSTNVDELLSDFKTSGIEVLRVDFN